MSDVSNAAFSPVQENTPTNETGSSSPEMRMLRPNVEEINAKRLSDMLQAMSTPQVLKNKRGGSLVIFQ